MTIQSVTVKELDFEDPSADDPNGPDIFVFFREAKTGGETKKSDVKEDMDPDDLPLEYSTSFKVGSNDFDQTLDIEISEHDDDDRRRGSVIGSVRLEDWDPYVAPYGSTPDEYPETITLEDERDGTKCTLELKWGK